jgi:large subunit ribosomal protein L17
MRHRKKGKKLGRTASHRKAMLANMVTSLFDKETIETTTAKAKAARSLAERLITVAKRNENTVSARRHVARVVRDKAVVKKLFDEIAPRYEGRPGGYTRIMRVDRRHGDGAEVAILQLVGSEAKLGKAKSKKKGED